MTTWQEKYPIKSEWKTRGGWKAMVVDHSDDGPDVYHYHNDAYPHHDGDLHSHFPNGARLYDEQDDCDLNCKAGQLPTPHSQKLLMAASGSGIAMMGAYVT